MLHSCAKLCYAGFCSLFEDFSLLKFDFQKASFCYSLMSVDQWEIPDISQEIPDVEVEVASLELH